jgi:hypothetical protein
MGAFVKVRVPVGDKHNVVGHARGHQNFVISSIGYSPLRQTDDFGSPAVSKDDFGSLADKLMIIKMGCYCRNLKLVF